VPQLQDISEVLQQNSGHSAACASPLSLLIMLRYIKSCQLCFLRLGFLQGISPAAAAGHQQGAATFQRPKCCFRYVTAVLPPPVVLYYLPHLQGR
jgi:hypothetical protein